LTDEPYTSAVSVDRLADAHVLELHFLEVRVDPHAAERHDRHQRGARRDALADLHRALRDIAGDRRRQGVARVVQVRVADLRGGGLHVRMLFAIDVRSVSARFDASC
jgi:hypothetical protein